MISPRLFYRVFRKSVMAYDRVFVCSIIGGRFPTCSSPRNICGNMVFALTNISIRA